MDTFWFTHNVEINPRWKKKAVELNEKNRVGSKFDVFTC